jgi:hypothetical protein
VTDGTFIGDWWVNVPPKRAGGPGWDVRRSHIKGAMTITK